MDGQTVALQCKVKMTAWTLLGKYAKFTRPILKSKYLHDKVILQNFEHSGKIVHFMENTLLVLDFHLVQMVLTPQHDFEMSKLPTSDTCLKKMC